MSKAPSKKMKFKLNIVVLGFLSLGFLTLIGRVIYIACFAEQDGVKYGVKAYNQQQSADTINANRGTIYDRNMNVLAQSATVWTVSVDPNQIKSDENKEKIAKGLSEILGMDYNKILEKTKANTKYEIVKKKVEKPQKDQITNFCKDNNLVGIHMSEDTKRYYPMGSTAAHTIGFVGSDNQGLLGLELSYDKELSGKAGKVTIAQDAKGGSMPFDYEYYYPAQDGNSLVLSLDSTLQHYCDKALNEVLSVRKPADRCLAMMMKVNTGEIVALSIKPDFDLNDPYALPNTNQYPAIKGKSEVDQRTANWKNKAVSETYMPGSVFKVVPGSASLEEGTMSLNKTFDCNGSYKVSDTTFHCWRRGGHGHETFTQAFINSCNPAFIQIGQSLGPELFFRYFSMYGLTEKTGIDVPGETDSIYLKEKDLTPVSLASESFGQSEAVTAVQMLTAFCAVVNGGNLVIPHFVNQVVDKNGNIVKSIDTNIKRQVISDTTVKNMRGILEEVVKGIDGNGTNASVSGYRVIGKSGTAQKLPRKDAYIGSFIGALPADDPQYALMVLVDEPTDGTYYGGTIASPVFSQIMSEAAPYLGFSPQYTEEELLNLSISVPACEGFSVNDAKGKLQKAGFKNIEILGSGDTVVKQVPSTGTNVSGTAKIILYTDQRDYDMVTVPNLTGMSQAAVNQTLVSAGLNLSLNNTSLQSQKAKATSQSPAAGQKVPRGSVITVQFLTNDETG